jgi:hypothetical protein
MKKNMLYLIIGLLVIVAIFYGAKKEGSGAWYTTYEEAKVYCNQVSKNSCYIYKKESVERYCTVYPTQPTSDAGIKNVCGTGPWSLCTSSTCGASTTTPDVDTTGCTDYDETSSNGGLNAYTKSYVFFDNEKYTDYCKSSSYLVEYYCDDSEPYSPVAKKEMSKTGYKCEDGKLVVDSTSETIYYKYMCGDGSTRAPSKTSVYRLRLDVDAAGISVYNCAQYDKTCTGTTISSTADDSLSVSSFCSACTNYKYTCSSQGTSIYEEKCDGLNIKFATCNTGSVCDGMTKTRSTAFSNAETAKTAMCYIPEVEEYKYYCDSGTGTDIKLDIDNIPVGVIANCYSGLYCLDRTSDTINFKISNNQIDVPDIIDELCKFQTYSDGNVIQGYSYFCKDNSKVYVYKYNSLFQNTEKAVLTCSSPKVCASKTSFSTTELTNSEVISKLCYVPDITPTDSDGDGILDVDDTDDDNDGIPDFLDIEDEDTTADDEEDVTAAEECTAPWHTGELDSKGKCKTNNTFIMGIFALIGLLMFSRMGGRRQ